MQPKSHYLTYSGAKDRHYFDVALLMVYSRKNKRKFTTFCEVGISARQYTSKNNPVGYTLIMLDGIRFRNGIVLSNYTEYEKTKSENFLYGRTIYDQISVAKEFYFDNLKTQYFTIQMGYFWKSSMKDSLYTVSGPIFSLWLDL